MEKISVLVEVDPENHIARNALVAFNTEGEVAEGAVLIVEKTDLSRMFTSVGVYNMLTRGHVKFPLTVTVGKKMDYQPKGVPQYEGTITTADGKSLAYKWQLYRQSASE